ncbi:MAG: hypothetical protein J6S91_07165, partial [Treponema sp.]|nr:hypothetical protein [Treponema sp.]
SPYIGRGKIRCNRLGGNAYFNIEGVPENNASADGVLQKTISTGNDITSGPQVSILSVNPPTTTTENEGSAWTVQSLQDVNCDRIPDVLKIVDEKCHVYLGKADSDGNIIYPDKPSFKTSDIKSLTMNHNNSTSRGFSISPAGGIQTLYSLSGKQKAVSLTNGFGESTFKGENETTATMLDINADGIPDYVYYDENEEASVVYLSKGTEYEKAFEYGWNSISKGKVSGNSGNISSGINISTPGNDNSTAQDITGGASFSYDLGGCVSVSTSVQEFMLMDMNGDGLADAVRYVEDQKDKNNIVYEVYYNTGSGIASDNPYRIVLPRWQTDGGSTNLTEGTGKIEVSNKAINSNKIEYGEKSAQLPEKSNIDVSNLASDMEKPDCSVTASVSITGNIGVSVTVKIPVWSGLYFNITANAGGGINSGSNTTSANVKMMDMDGDGLPDHVLKADGKIWWKRNMMGKVGLLNRINLPQGGDIQIDYSEKYGTRDNPSFKYVMSKVTVNDGTDGTGPLPKIEHGKHSVTTLYEYDGGYYDRKRKDFYGFRTVKTTFADGTYQVDEYYNREYYSKCVPEVSTLYAKKETEAPDKEGAILSKSWTTLCEAPLVLPKKEESWTYEKTSGEDNFIHTVAEYAYDSMGNCTDITQSFDDGTKLSAKIRYEDINPNSYIMGLPVDIKVYGTGGSQLLRHRTGKYDGKGQLVELHQYYSETGYITNRLTYDKYGNISSVVDNQGATISYMYDGAENMFPTEISQYGKDTDTYTGKVDYYIDTQTKAIETDCNGNTMTYKYDDWQRISKIFTAYDGETPAISYIYHTPVEAIDGNRELWYAV